MHIRCNALDRGPSRSTWPPTWLSSLHVQAPETGDPPPAIVPLDALRTKVNAVKAAFPSGGAEDSLVRVFDDLLVIAQGRIANSIPIDGLLILVDEYAGNARLVHSSNPEIER